MDKSVLEKMARLKKLRLAKEAEAAAIVRNAPGSRGTRKLASKSGSLRRPTLPAGATAWDEWVHDVLEQALRNDRQDRIALISALVSQGVSNIEEMGSRFGGPHVRDAHLAHVTMIVNGKPRTNAPGDWLRTDLAKRTYTIHPEFASAWKRAVGEVRRDG